MTPPLIVGSASRDLTADDPRGWRLGGGATYCGLTLAQLGLRPRIVLGVDREAAVATELDLLRGAGADLHLIPLSEGPVFRNEDTPDGRIQFCETPGDRLPPLIPDEWRESETLLLAPVADELGPAWADLAIAFPFVALGWQGLLRRLPRGGMVSRLAPAASSLIRLAGLISVSREDIGPEVAPATLLSLVNPPATVLITDGVAGGIVMRLQADGSLRSRRYPAISAAATVDPTGAGDAFLAAMVAAHLGHPLAGSGRSGSDLRLAAAIASLVLEAPGLYGVPTLDAIAERLRRSMTGPRAIVDSTSS
ncbi:MAG: PfkB family carbohydrate kinase [Chloroflexota bacterium]